eukprot:Pgem_evm1s11539
MFEYRVLPVKRKITIPPNRRKLWRSILQPGNTDVDNLSITRVNTRHFSLEDLYVFADRVKIRNQNVKPTLEYQWSNESEYELRK